ncbi:MAG: folylpolyglutamate synthase/dihydrofolate synthase family protein [Bacteroidales bacterium]|nr:folylpolyglutamate synthase/dihydrofolate synthase family protein [Bacteroidales bacterium]
MTYQQTLDYLYARLPMYQRVGAQAYKADLANTIRLCDMLGNPQNSFPSIHIAGTNGKGSVSHMVASILHAAGFRTGLYTSPHLKDFRERIRVNGKMVDKRFVKAFVQKYRDRFIPIQPSFFELTVGMAFEYFREQNVDIAVVESGMGGRLDSTNIITPLVSVITNVSFDHMQFLGDTLEKIAAEKAGIIKPDVPVVIGETQQGLESVFRQKADMCRSEILFADKLFHAIDFRLDKMTLKHSSMDIFRDGINYIKQLISPLAGNYQRKNILTVMGVCEQLNKQGFGLSPSIISTGIKETVKRTGLAGRWQILSRNPLTICDTCHNEGGMSEALVQIATTPHHHLHFVFGVVNDKHLAPILAMLPRDATYYFCKPDIPRGLDAAVLMRDANKAGLKGESYESVQAALHAAQTNACEDDLIFVGGSMFVVAEVV